MAAINNGRISVEAAMQWWRLDSEGELRWRESPGHRVRAGDPAGYRALKGRFVWLRRRLYRADRIAYALRHGHWPDKPLRGRA